MTKCHLIIFCVFLTLLPGCKPKPQGPSLSELGSHSKAAQQARFESYAQELATLPLQEALLRQYEMLDDAETDSTRWREVTSMQEHFFLDPNSPFRNEELYLPVAERIVASPLTSDTERERALWVVPRLRLNRLGRPAADFPFTLRNGRPTSLYETIDLHPAAQHTLLFFSNPGCPNCKEITETLMADAEMSAQIASGKLLVVNIYPDEDLDAWYDYLPHYPADWVCGYDPDQLINSDTLYWIRAIPSLYLLDEEKRVVRKDAPLEVILVDCKQR